MKRIVTLMIVVFATSIVCNAQSCKTKPPTSPKKIEQFVSNLSATQKKRIELLHKNCRSDIAPLRNQQRKVRDSIAYYNDLYGDHTKIIYDLYEREAEIQVQLSKRFYEMKVALDKILTKEQHEEFIKKMKYR